MTVAKPRSEGTKVAIGGAVPIPDPHGVTVGRTYAVPLVGLGKVHAVSVLPRVLVKYGVSLVVAAHADEPAEDAGGRIGRCVRRVEHVGIDVPSVPRPRVVAGDRPPVDLPSRDARPTLNSREKSLDAWVVASDAVAVLFVFVDD
jgi:hypothetical protein